MFFLFLSGSISWSYHYDWTYNKTSKIICVVNACGISQWMRRTKENCMYCSSVLTKATMIVVVCFHLIMSAMNHIESQF